MGELAFRIVAADDLDIGGAGSPFTADRGAADWPHVDAKPNPYSTASARADIDRETDFGGRRDTDPPVPIRHAVAHSDTIAAACWGWTCRG